MTTAAEQGAQGTPAPIVTTPPATPAATPVAPAAPTPVPPVGEPDWLPARLERQAASAKAALLAELGIDDPAKAKAFIEAGKAAENEKKSLAEKLTEQTTAATTARAQAERYSGIIALQAAAQMGALTAEQQAAVKAIAGEDPAEQLRAVVALAPTWVAKAPAATPQATQQGAPAAAAPASTVSTTGGPPAVGSTSPTDHKAVFAELNKTNPVAAAHYARVNRVFQS